ncbi:MAG: helix-turn-helix transcriptional regulator [Oscillospiraceae bacterium]|nr:helix-turn-helix transcriptional regulator [Oscillospiraceae bacterium]
MRTKKEINIESGEQIKHAREKAKLTQEQFAERIDVSPLYVSDLERGVVGASLATLKRACVVLGVSSDQILFGKTAESRINAIGERCKALSNEEFDLLLEMTDIFVRTIELTKWREV